MPLRAVLCLTVTAVVLSYSHTATSRSTKVYTLKTPSTTAVYWYNPCMTYTEMSIRLLCSDERVFL